MKKVINMSSISAKKYFLKSESYFNLDLPFYFNFNKLLMEVEGKLNGHQLADYFDNAVKPSSLDDVNYKFLHNKDGRYSWRPFQIIHPALYIELVNQIIEKDNWKLIKNRFKEFQKNRSIVCCSIPSESASKRNDKRGSITNWWSNFEQESISLSLEYDYCAQTDISNCYSSIYTHTLVWAIHTKDIAKQNTNDYSLIGNKIDRIIRWMSYNQTNGIPQGSNLMDFIAEIVLGYADLLLSERLEEFNIYNYKILRYRDDYRIFSQDTTTINKILKILTEVLAALNFKLNGQKTDISNDVIGCSVKSDKIYLLDKKLGKEMNIQKQLLVIRNLGRSYPNCGSLSTTLTQLYKTDVLKLKRKPKNIMQIISIITDIMINNPRTYSICSAILSKLLTFGKDSDVTNILNKIEEKFSKIPNTEYLNIWLQRISISFNRNREYSTKLCQKIYTNTNIWNSTWLRFPIDESLIIDNNGIQNTPKIISIDEVDIFHDDYY